MDFLTPLMEQVNAMTEGFIKTLPMMGIAVIVLILTWIVSKIIRMMMSKVLDRSHLRPSLKTLILTLTKLGVWIVGGLIALAIIFPSLTPAKLLAALGLGSIAIGFAFQDVFENFLAGVMIMLRKPMRIGDFIECEGFEGKIEEIHIRESFIRQTDGQLVLVPNSYLFKNPVYVRTHLKERRFTLVCGVGYGEDVAEAKSVIEKSLQGLSTINYDKPVEVYASEFNSSSVDFTIRWWSGSKPVDMYKSRDEVIIAIKKALDDADIEIPFPYRTLTFSETLNLKAENDDDAQKDKGEDTPQNSRKEKGAA